MPATAFTLKELGPLGAWAGKAFGGADLGLSGCEVSFNRFNAGQTTPFVHAHKLNEEVYIVVQGGGLFYVDGQELPIQEGSVVRCAPAAQRALKAGGQGLTYLCIQAQAGSLTQASRGDGIRFEQVLPSWAQAQA
jgi:uncharacterized cupin superfamily protein